MADLDANVIREVERLARNGFETRIVGLPDGSSMLLVPTGFVPAEDLVPKEPVAAPIELSTLNSLVGYLLSDPKAHDGHLLHVKDPGNVSLLSPLKGHYRQRELLARATLHREGFPFGRFMSVEDFVIAVQLGFVKTADKATVLAIAGNVRQEAVRTSTDDGVSQSVATRVGITRAQETPVPKTVQLAPFRTFSEIEQPASPFLFRMKGGSPEQLPQVALFEADGGAWRLEAMSRIAEWFSRQTIAEVWPPGIKPVRILF